MAIIGLEWNKTTDVLQWIQTTKIRYLIQDGEEIKKYTELWEIVGPAPATETVFDTHGMTDLSIIPDSAIFELTDPKLLFWTDDINNSCSMILTALPTGRIIYPSDDMPIGSIEGVESFTLTFNQTAGGLILLLASTDSGETWRAWDGSAWITVDDTNLAEVKSKGMSPVVLNNLTREHWDALFADQAKKKLRFAYYLEQDSTADAASTDNLVGTFEMKGSWDGAILGQEYIYGYPDNTVLTIKITADGDYKINY